MNTEPFFLFSSKGYVITPIQGVFPENIHRGFPGKSQRISVTGIYGFRVDIPQGSRDSRNLWSLKLLSIWYNCLFPYDQIAIAKFPTETISSQSFLSLIIKEISQFPPQFYPALGESSHLLLSNPNIVFNEWTTLFPPRTEVHIFPNYLSSTNQCAQYSVWPRFDVFIMMFHHPFPGSFDGKKTQCHLELIGRRNMHAEGEILNLTGIPSHEEY